MNMADEEATMRVGAELAAQAKPGDVITLSGPLGVGKTALVRGFLAALGHETEVPSPSFSIVQPYEEVEPRVWHVDLYRIERPSELDELGLDSAADAVLIVEWPERAGNEVWPQALSLSLEFGPNDYRILTVEVPPSWEGRWPPQ